MSQRGRIPNGIANAVAGARFRGCDGSSAWKHLCTTLRHFSRAGLNPRLLCWRVMASQLLDLRSLSKPQCFEGQEQKWRDWRFSFEAYCGLLKDGFQTAMQQSSEYPNPVGMSALSPEKQEISKTLFYVLVQLLGGRALSIVRMVRDQNG